MCRLVEVDMPDFTYVSVSFYDVGVRRLESTCLMAWDGGHDVAECYLVVNVYP
jgi:hypothetical protein